MSVALRYWEGHIYKASTEVGFATGTVTIDRGLQTFYALGNYDLAARREASREITGTIDHGFIDVSLFATAAMGTTQLTTFDIQASFAANAIVLSGCSIETYDFDIPADGWITESISFRAKTVKSW